MANTPLALYIHIPFCKSRCTYCDFNAYAGLDHLRDRYTAGLGAELRAWGQTLDRPAVRAVFFGGGTPTRLDAGQFAAIFEAAHDGFILLPDAEITTEANPATIDEAQLRALRALGINRISLGVQSFDDRLLAPLHRAHTAADAVEAYELVRRVGFDNVNLDLIYALPEQTFAGWAETLAQAIALAPEHLSLYCLTIEEGTPLSASVRGGQIRPPDPDLAADMAEHAERVLQEAGYDQYEISNWSRPGFRCRHNLVYWRNEPYLGVGAGAHSHLGKVRFANIRPPGRYAERALAQQTGAGGQGPGAGEGDQGSTQVSELMSGRADLTPGLRPPPLHTNVERGTAGGVPPHLSQTVQQSHEACPSPARGSQRSAPVPAPGPWPPAPRFPIPALIDFTETIDGGLEVAETLMLGLRLNEGVDLAAVAERFGVDVQARFGSVIAEMTAFRLLTEDQGRLRLTARGRLLGNEVFQRVLSGE